jgi:uncharacterized protein (TIGR02466 family)
MLYKRYFTSEVASIFPTPIYISNLGRKITSQELKFVEKNKKDFHKNEGNIASNNNYILNEKPFAELKYQMELRIHDYFNKVICSSNNIKPYITQSWLNYTETNQYHHKHAHPNSLVSGVFYLNCNEKFDGIVFFKNNYNNIQPEQKSFNLWNSDSWHISVKTGDIIMFPSSLSHMVDTKQGDNTRVSLAFNVFVKGTLGNNKKLTELIL